MNNLEWIGLVDTTVGLTILVGMLFSSAVCRCPMWRKVVLWLISMGFMYQAIRHFHPERFSDNEWMAVFHGLLWLALFFSVYWFAYKRPQITQ